MQTTPLIIMLIGLTMISFWTGRSRARQYQASARLPALPGHYGYMTAMWSAIPAFLLLLGWSMYESSYLNQQIVNNLPAEMVGASADQLNLYINNVLLSVSQGGGSEDPGIQNAANAYMAAQSQSRIVITILVAVLALSGIEWLAWNMQIYD